MAKRRTKKSRYLGRTQAFRRFREHIWRTHELLDAGLVGIEEKSGKFDGILDKFKGVKAPPGPRPRDYEPQLKSAKDGKNISLTMDSRTAAMLRSVLSSSKRRTDQIRFHLYSILAVSIWGAFETYVTMLFEELFALEPRMLMSQEQVTYAEILENEGDIVRLLIEKQLERIGHFGFVELCSYLDARIGFAFAQSMKRDLHDLYTVRNIIAHGSGLIRSDVEQRVPKAVPVEGGEIRVNKKYLNSAIACLERAITSLEKHVDRKFYKQRS